MSTRVLIGIAVAVLLLGAYKADNLAASYIALIGGFIVYLIHTIEFKLNKLLDYHGVTVTDQDISKD